MTRQAPESANALFVRLQPYFDDSLRTGRVETAAGQAAWPRGWGRDIPDVKTIVVHTTDGWPTRDKAVGFVERYTDPRAKARGIGPHFYMSGDGAVFRLLSENRVCWHGSHTNAWAIGVETGNLTATAHPIGSGGPWPRQWTQLSTEVEDLPGAKLYAISVNGEILVSPWSTTSRVQADAHAAGRRMMLIQEEQYRSWALLARWLCEVWRVPRNFPLRPHLMRSDAWQGTEWRTYRKLVNADPMRDAHIRNELNVPPYNCTDATFEDDTPATGLPHVYAQGVATSTWTRSNPSTGRVTRYKKKINNLWTAFFNSFRGIHGHGFSGANTGSDHNCPGAWFDWHRLAREVWDWWWFPFDLVQAAPSEPIASGRPVRDYGRTDGTLREHYFDEDAALYGRVSDAGFFPIGDETVAPGLLSGPPRGPVCEMNPRYGGFWHGGMHFQLDAGSPLYAMAAGQLVAARLGAPSRVEGALAREAAAGPYPSPRFVLLRHEVWYRRSSGSERIDYDQGPARVYTLYSHLGAASHLDTTSEAAGNPSWLNRALAMKKEYDLGLAFRAVHPSPAAQWAPHVRRWQRRKAALDLALAELQAGRVARFPEGDDAIRVALGDFVGVAGHLAENTFGAHLEVFSRDPIDDPWFEPCDQGRHAARAYHHQGNFDDVSAFICSRSNTPLGVAVEAYRQLSSEEKAMRFRKVALRAKSEWALCESDFPDGGWNEASDLMWWSAVVPAMNAALSDAAAQLPVDAVVWHYHPLGFMDWLNQITWRSEWPKYRVVDAAGAEVPAPPRPPRRR